MNENLINTIRSSENRFDLWSSFINKTESREIVELGVYKGDFAEKILKSCPIIQNYLMIDPWRNLTDWNKPANADNETFEKIYQEAIVKTDFAKDRRKILRGKTKEVISEIENESLDFGYIDADHTLRGITVDLINILPKIKSNGFIAGDDFNESIWQHHSSFEPTLVFPFAVYFAEAMDLPIYGLPHNQFIIEKSNTGFEFVDLTDGKYGDISLRDHFQIKKVTNVKTVLKHLFQH